VPFNKIKKMMLIISTIKTFFKKIHFFLKILTDIPKKSVIFARGLISLVILNFVL